MQFRGMEDRLNPVTPAGADESTLGGYAAVHGRAPGFEGGDGSAFTVAIETEMGEDGGWAAYLVFLRWAEAGSAIMGHLETPDIARGSTEAEVRRRAEAAPLTLVKQLLEEAIARKTEWEEE